MKQTLESECKVAIQWFHKNRMIVNPDKFHAIVLDKRRSNNSEVKFIIGSEQIQAVSSADILGIATDDKLNFNLHIDKICLKSANQLNAFVWLKRFLGDEERKALIVLIFQTSIIFLWFKCWQMRNLYIKLKLLRKGPCVSC